MKETLKEINEVNGTLLRREISLKSVSLFRIRHGLDTNGNKHGLDATIHDVRARFIIFSPIRFTPTARYETNPSLKAVLCFE